MKPKKILTSFSLLLMSAILFTSACKHEPPVLPAQVTPTDATNGNGGNGGNGGFSPPPIILNTCDSDTIYFQTSILPLFVSNCAMSGCHDPVSHREGIVLNTYANIMSTGHIHPFSLSGSSYNSMITTDPGDRMPPPPRPAMTAAQINMISAWINQGALNNSCDCGCDTTNVTYSGTIAPLFQTQCNGCHNNSSPGGNINLTTYAGVHAVAVNGHLYGSVNQDAGFSAMPKNSQKLPDCMVSQIRIWIQNGSLNN